jgi:Zn-dependent membrane protease YugP
MYFGLFWGDWTILVLIPGMLFTFWAQFRVNSTFQKYSATPLQNGMTGAAVARRILDSNGLRDVNIEIVRGHLSDHYDPRKRVLRLSEAVFHGNNVAAVGVAAHEAGHALQHDKRYVPLYLRMSLIPVCRIGSGLAMPLFLIGFLFAGVGQFSDIFMLLGIAAFSLSVLFQLVTLPVEFNASRRALRCIAHSGTMSQQQLEGARRVLSAAAMTYVAALAAGLLSLLRLVLLAGGRSRRR